MTYIKKIFEGTVISFISSIMASFLGYILKLFLARSFTVEEFGFIFAFLSFFNMFTVFYNLGIERALVRYLPEFKVRGRHKSILRMFFWSMMLQFVLAAIICCILFIVRVPIAMQFFKTEIPGIFTLFGLVYVLLSPVTLVESALRGMQKIKMLSLYTLANNAILILSTFGLYLYLPQTLKVMSLMISYIFFYLMTLGGVFILLHIRGFNFFKIDKGSVRMAVNFGIPIFAVSMFRLIFSRMDTLFITFFNGLEEVAYYNVVDSTASAVLTLIKTFSIIYLPVVSEMWAKKEFLEVEVLMSRMIKYSLMLAIPAALMLVFQPKSIVNFLFGEDFEPSYRIMIAYAPIIILNPLRNVFSPALLSADQTKYIAHISLTGFLIDFIGNILFIPIWGGVGATISSVAGSCVIFVMILHKVREYVKVRFPFKQILKTILASAAFLLAFSTVYAVVNIQPHIDVALSAFTSGIIYIIGIFALRVVTFDEIKEFVRHD